MRFGEVEVLSFAKTQFFITFWRIVLFVFRQNSIFYHVLANCVVYLSPKLNFLSRFGELSVCPDNKKAGVRNSHARCK